MALGLVTATVGFVVLAGTSQTTQAVLNRDIARAWPAPYDILVRPEGTRDPVEVRSGLVRPNYLSGLRGGITEAQVDQVRAVPGVAVAAPIAIVGFTYWSNVRFIDLAPYLEKDKISFFRFSVTSVGDNGHSTYPSQTTDVAASSSGRTVMDWDRSHSFPGTPTVRIETNLETGSSVYKCTFPERCIAPTSCVGSRSAPNSQCFPGSVAIYNNYPVPILIAGIDPVAEAGLVGLDKCVISGRYLRAEDAPAAVTQQSRTYDGIPVLTSNQSFIRETVNSSLQKSSTRPAESISQVTDWITVSESTSTADDLYRAFLPSVSSQASSAGPIWETGFAKYSAIDADHLQVEAVTPDPTVLRDLSEWPVDIPEAQDTWLRPIKEAAQLTPPGMVPGYRWTYTQVGTYDPTCLPGFSTPSGRMDAYNVPELRTRDGQSVFPTRSLASYVNVPPLVLTSMEGAKYFANPHVDEGAPGDAFISAIRIRVSGTESHNPQSEARLARVAAEIQQRTHLQVDIIRGSSPRPMTINLPAGKFGRPAMAVTEAWSEVGVAFKFARATSLTNLILFVIAVIACGLLVGQTAYTGVRQRRRQLAMLHALGWPPWRVALLIELEAGLIGLIAGVIAATIGYLLLQRLNLGISPASPLLAAPIAVFIALITAAIPAILAARSRPVVGMSERGRVRTSRPLAGAGSAGARNLLNAWGPEAAAAVAGLWLGASMVGALVLVTVGFRGQLDASVLGATLAEHVAPYHYALIGITAVIGLLGALEVLTLSYLERRPQLAVLRSLGWPRSAVASLIGGEGAVVGVAASALAVLTVIAMGLALSAPAGPIVYAAVAAAATGVFLAAVSLFVPAIMAYTVPVAEGMQST
jgi:hypothetical protein